MDAARPDRTQTQFQHHNCIIGSRYYCPNQSCLITDPISLLYDIHSAKLFNKIQKRSSHLVFTRIYAQTRLIFSRFLGLGFVAQSQWMEIFTLPLLVRIVSSGGVSCSLVEIVEGG